MTSQWACAPLCPHEFPSEANELLEFLSCHEIPEPGRSEKGLQHIKRIGTQVQPTLRGVINDVMLLVKKNARGNDRVVLNGSRNGNFFRKILLRDFSNGTLPEDRSNCCFQTAKKESKNGRSFYSTNCPWNLVEQRLLSNSSRSEMGPEIKVGFLRKTPIALRKRLLVSAFQADQKNTFLIPFFPIQMAVDHTRHGFGFWTSSMKWWRNKPYSRVSVVKREGIII